MYMYIYSDIGNKLHTSFFGRFERLLELSEILFPPSIQKEEEEEERKKLRRKVSKKKKKNKCWDFVVPKS